VKRIKTTAVVWFRRDLRLTDNPALCHAVEHADRVVCLYIHSPQEEGRWRAGGASRWWLHHSLQALQKQIKESRGTLVLRSGPALAALKALILETNAELLTWNRLFEPLLDERDAQIETTLGKAGIECVQFNGSLLFDPADVATKSGTPFRVYTPFWRHCTQRLGEITRPAAAPQRIPAVLHVHSESLDGWKLLTGRAWEGRLSQHWTPGEHSAHATLSKFTESAIDRYSQGRDRPDIEGTSRLSPHLHFGEIGPRQILAAIENRTGKNASTQRYLSQIGWREFAHHLLVHFPHTPEEPLDPRFSLYPWTRSTSALKAWQRGNTGIPLVDAGMRELWHTGWMHNRVRMIVASLLTKNLRLNWVKGAHWFWDTLVDADLANNTLGWQWVAGCGADASPYFRIFNPVLQAKRFDLQREYIRHWVPELAALSNRWIHHPWAAPAEELAKAGVRLGKTYPRPIVDLKKSRTQALDGYSRIRQARKL
jgi:deoxyribodipyrimidine photo-lyase